VRRVWGIERARREVLRRLRGRAFHPAGGPPSIVRGAGRDSRASATGSPGSAPGEISEGERKIVTALFADIKGSTELEQDLDPEEARAIVDPALKLMIEAACRYDGYVVQSTGDGIFALFGAPVAHEDHPQRANLQKLLRVRVVKPMKNRKVVY
jgi:class 3 adenylate cyclase